MLDDVRTLVDAAYDDLVDVRRAVHTRPELAFEEVATTALVRDRMRSLGASELPCPTPTGGVFSLDGGRPGRTVLVRADIDALPVHEEVDVPYASRIDGRMHACGHDAHVAAALGAAEVVSRRAETLAGRYVFLFQPAEEALGGAKAMVDGGVLDAVAADWLVGLHVTSLIPSGLVAVRPGVFMSDAQLLRFRVTGPGGHGAMPGAGDVVAAAAAVIGGLREAVDGFTFEGSPCACSAGVVRAGTASNVVPRSAVVEGTLRTFTPEQKRDAVRRLEELCARIGDAGGTEVTLELGVSCPPVRNDATATGVVRRTAAALNGEGTVLEVPPVTPSDDVSEFLERVPGCYYFLGAGVTDAEPGMHHSPTFRIDEGALRVGAATLVASAIELAGTDPAERR